jgi:dTDP-4-dehydrorhamnose reductase
MKLLLLGKSGQVGWELQRSLAPLGHLVAYGRGTVDLEDANTVRRTVREAAPDVIVNAAAYTAVDKAESEPGKARAVNAEAVGALALEARECGAWLVHYSTDYVFDGRKPGAYVEDDDTGPLSVYGRTKLEGEQAIRESHDRHLIFRTSWVYAARGGNFVRTILRLASEREQLKIVADQIGAPTSAELIADVTALAIYRLQLAGPAAGSFAGTYHLAAGGETTWCDYARLVVKLALERGAKLTLAPQDIEPIPTESYPTPAARPRNSRLATRKLEAAFNIQLPVWRFHVERMLRELDLQDRW